MMSTTRRRAFTAGCILRFLGDIGVVPEPLVRCRIAVLAAAAAVAKWAYDTNGQPD